MQGDFSQIGPFLLAALVVFIIYRRFRRNFGRQLLSPGRMKYRMVVLAVIGCLLLSMTLRSGQYLAAIVGGVAAGVGLGLWGAERTRFQMYGERLHYIPHTYTGIAVSLLFLGRLVYRVAQVYAGAHTPSGAHGLPTNAADPSQPFAAASMVRSPLTVAIVFVLIGYYVCYYSLVLRKSKHLKPEDIEIAASTAAPTS
jgi:hypothetical protein